MKALFGKLAAMLALTLAATFSMAHDHGMKGKNIVETAVEAGSFSTLVAAVQAAGLVDTLANTKGLTVFAPTDEAFAKLPAGTVESLLEPENRDQLVAILTYHVVPSKITSDMLERGANTAPTVQGDSVVVTLDDSGATINGANITATDIMASNGVIHVIDTVILPE
ncbi:fasciclin domain-containing protein [Salinibius halmophilus]|uniref:fasciclin domain-containing protein n=1 Tax=Salinibius halmophilus TaxID=1853216 RepID=UPI000E66DBF8|nr:fasciclin domain-containing protein [Salinibius halmophilus]